MAGYAQTRTNLINDVILELSSNVISDIKKTNNIKTTQKNIVTKIDFYEEKLTFVSLNSSVYKTTKNSLKKYPQLEIINEKLGTLLYQSYLLLKTVKLIKSDSKLNSQLQSLRISLYNNGLININQGVRK